MLGEHVTPAGQRYDVQLKGAGITPYSRRGDGRAVLGPMLREYVISSAFDALNIPTTSSLAVTVTGETVQREVAQPGAVLTQLQILICVWAPLSSQLCKMISLY